MAKAELFTRTKRFNIYKTTVDRNNEPVGSMPRDVYMAWFHDEDVTRPVCTVTLWCGLSFGNYIEWIETGDGYRRQGIASEVLHALEQKIGCLDGEGVTESGEAFCENYHWRQDDEAALA